MTTTPAAPANPFAFHIGPQTCLARAATAAARPILSKLLGLGRLRDLYRDAARLARPTGVAGPPTFEGCTLQLLNIRLRVHAAGAAIPSTGPLIVAANHPTGALDGLALIEAIRAVRSDVRLLANHLLARIPELAESCSSSTRSAASRRSREVCPACGRRTSGCVGGVSWSCFLPARWHGNVIRTMTSSAEIARQ